MVTLTPLVTVLISYDGVELSLLATLRDTFIMEIFIGFRVLEYTQFQLLCGQPFTMVPDSSTSASGGDKPVAFILMDFQLYSAKFLEISGSDILRGLVRSLSASLQLSHLHNSTQYRYRIELSIGGI